MVRLGMLLGSLLLVFGIFAPIASAPFLGSINIFMNGRVDGVILLIAAEGAFAAALASKYWVGFIASGLGAFICGNVWYRLSSELPRIQAKSAKDLGEGIVAGVANLTFSQLHADWGIAILLIGTLLCFSCATVGTPKKKTAALMAVMVFVSVVVSIMAWGTIISSIQIAGSKNEQEHTAPQRSPEDGEKYRKEIREIIRRMLESNK
jgi:hypothetical protein